MSRISKWPKWKINALMLDETDIEIRKEIENYKLKISNFLKEQNVHDL